MIKSFLVLIILTLVVNQSINAQGFNSVTTPDGVNVIAVGNSGKLYRSANSGSSWASYTNGALNMNSVASLGNDVWIAANNGTVYKTQKTFAPVQTYSVGSSTNLYSITFTDSNTGFACGDGGAVYKSVNGGVNWTLSNTGISSVKLNSISFRNSSNGTVIGNGGNIYSTSNGGSSWSLQTSGTVRNLFKVKYFNDSIAAVGEYGTLLLNTGSGWTSVVTRTNSDIRGVSGTSMNDIHVCGGGGFIRNNKGGSSGFLNFEINPMLANLVDIFYYNNLGIAVSSLNSVIINTTNGGTSWNMSSGSTVSMNWISKTPSGGGIGNNLCPHPTDRNSMYVVYNNKVYISRDRGDNWTQIATISIGSSCHSFYVSPVDTNIWMAAMVSSPDCIVRSTNYGANWTTIISYDFSTYGQPLEMDQNNPSTYYFAPSNAAGIGLFKSTNNGANFTLIAPYNSAGIDQPCDIILEWDNSSVIFLGDDGADIWKSVNGGLNWTLVKAGSSSEVPSMCNSVFDKSLYYATTWSSGQVFKSVNFGSNWSVVSNNSGSGWGSDLCREDPTVVLTGVYGSQSYLTTNSGASFLSVDNGLSGAGAGIIVPERGYMLNMQTGNLFKLNITYTDFPVSNSIDVQALSVGLTGVNYFTSPTIIPTGTVKNNNGTASATFNVTRKITPGSYVSTKTVSNLAANTSTSVSFDVWTFNSGTSYTIKDSVYIVNDENPANDVISGSLTPILGKLGLCEGFNSVTFPPTSWTLEGSGTMYWTRNAVSSYGLGTGSAKYDFWSSPNGVVQSLVTPNFSAAVPGDSIGYDYAYAPYNTSVDSLIIETSSDGGNSYSALVRLYGQTGASGQYVLNTATSGGAFTPTAGQWLKKKWSLPVGTNKIRFKAVSAFGNNLYLDSIRTSCGVNLYSQYNIKLAPQGMLNGTTLSLRDSVKAYLRNNSSPYNKVDSAVSAIDSLTLNAAFVFKNVSTGTYYLQIMHRNALETWSKNGGEFLNSGAVSNYDFTASQSQAYGNNMIQVGSKWCIYSGDVDGDGNIDITDIIEIYNDVVTVESGYLKTDLNGDGTIDVSDLLIAYNNATSIISKITPGSSPSDMQKSKEELLKKLIEFNQNLNKSK